MNNAILLIEDDDSLRRGICVKLKKEGYDVLCAETLAAANALFSANRVSLIICDIGLPDGSGLDFCREVRRESNVMFLFLTAQDTEIDMVNGYEAGADDYITKPFGMMEMVSRIKAVLRRTKKEDAGDDLVYEDIRVCNASHKVFVKDREVELTKKEYDLLSHLIRNQGVVLTRDQLLNSIWGYDFDGETRTVDVHVRSLRQKLGSAGDYVTTVRGIGYRIGE